MTSLFDKMITGSGWDPSTVSKNSSMGRLFASHGVRDTAELRRVLNLPRRRWETGLGGRFGTPENLAKMLTEVFARPGGAQTLRPVQAACLMELHDFGGLLAPIRVGGGKTLVSFLAAKVLEAKRPLLLVPAKLRAKTEREWLIAQRDWVLPPIRTESYEMLGREQHAEMLSNYGPDLLICDEGHRLKNPKAACTRRVKRYIEECRAIVKVVIMSGTITSRSLHEYWHLLRWCLGDQAMPLPAHWGEMTEWACALDASVDFRSRNSPGALKSLCDEEELKAFEADDASKISAVRKAYARRLTETPGVISTVDSQVACSLVITQVQLNLDHLAPYFRQLRELWETPDGHPFSEAVDLWRHARELAVGFYYKWDPRPPKEWLSARRTWCKVVRRVLAHSQTYDSEKQVAAAVSNGDLDYTMDGELGEVIDARVALEKWREVRDTFEVNQVPVWIDDAMLKFAAKWMTEHNGIVWVEHVAFGEKLAKISGRHYYGRGGLNSKGQPIESENGPCIASILANSEGRNLQHYSESLIVSCPPNGKTYEQLLGRLHRDGQTADEVTFEMLLPCKEALEGFHKALESDARYAQDTTRNSQKLLFADVTVMTADEAARMSGPLWE